VNLKRHALTYVLVLVLDDPPDRDGVDTVFVDHPCFHEAVDNIYGRA